MLAALLIAFREAIEAGLIIGIVLATTRGVAGRGRAVIAGMVAGVAGSVILAVFAGAIYDAFSGYGQDILNASILLLAVAMLTWHNTWMAMHARTLAAEVRSVGHDVAAGTRSLFALFMIIFLAVMREGSEIVLFFYGITVSGDMSNATLLAGGAAGLALGAALSATVYYGLLRIPVSRLFSVTSWMITLLAAGLAAQAALYLQQYGIAGDIRDPIWDTSHILSQESLPGQILHTLVGYMDQPNAVQLGVYAATLAVIAALTWYCRAVTAAPQPRRA